MTERCGLYFYEFLAEYPERSRAVLTGFALSGIQNYIFGTEESGWSLSGIRSSSRYVELVTRAVGEELSRRLDAFRPRLLMVSSGKGYLLTGAHTPGDRLAAELNRMKRGLFLAAGGRLELAAGAVPVTLVRPGSRRPLGGPWPDGLARVHQVMEKEKFQCRALFGVDRGRDRIPQLEPEALLGKEPPLPPIPWEKPGLLKFDLDNLGMLFASFSAADQKERASRALEGAIRRAVARLPDLLPLFSGGDDLLLLCPPERAVFLAAALRRELTVQITGERELAGPMAGFGLSCGCLPSFDPRLPALYYLDRVEELLERAKTCGKNRLALDRYIMTWDQVERLGDLLEKNAPLFHDLRRGPVHYGAPELLLRDIFDRGRLEEDRALAEELLALFGRRGESCV